MSTVDQCRSKAHGVDSSSSPLNSHPFYCVALADTAALDITQVGGKGLGLARLARMPGVALPTTFVITADAFATFVRVNSLQPLVEALDRLAAEWARGEQRPEAEPALLAASAQLRQAILSGAIPDAVEQAIAAAYERLAHQSQVDAPAVAVRSSGTAEDLAEASFAGQHATLLARRGFTEVLEAVRECWASLFSDRAVAYRNQLALRHTGPAATATETYGPHSAIGMAVVVQRMVDASAAGVGLNVHRGRGQPGIYLELHPGLGEALVSGQVSPDRFFVDPSTWRVEERETLGATPVASDETVAAIAASVHRIGEHFRARYGYRYIDTEFALDQSGKLWLLQARPETVWSRPHQPLIRVLTPEAPRGAQRLFAGGVTATPGVATGRLCLVLNLAERAKVLPGDILVTGSTSPEWELEFQQVGAVITDMGGRTSHAAMRSGELGLPCMVAARDAVATLAAFDGQVVTCDALGCVVYLGALPTVEVPLEEALRHNGGAVAETAPLPIEPVVEAQRARALREDAGGQWVAKPNYPLGRLQGAFYLAAFEDLAARFHHPLRVQVQADTVYVHLADLEGLTRGLAALPPAELEAILAERVASVAQLVSIAQTFECTAAGLAGLFERYVAALAHIHLRWQYDRLLAGRLEEWLAAHPADTPFVMAVLTTQRRSRLAQEANAAFETLCAAIRDLAAQLAAAEPVDAEVLLRAAAEELRDQIGLYAETHVAVDCDDIRLGPPVARVLRKLEQALLDGTAAQPAASPPTPPPPPEAGPAGGLAALVDLVIRQANQKEDEHYLLPRAHWHIRRKLLAWGQRLVEQGRLHQPDEVFEARPEDLLAWADD